MITGTKVNFFTGEAGEDCQVTVDGKTTDMFGYQFDVDDLMSEFDWTMHDFEAYIAGLVGSTVKLYWINIENDVDQHFIFRLEEPSEFDVVYVRVQESADACVVDVFSFDVPRPHVRTPGLHEYAAGKHAEHVFTFSPFEFA